MRSNGKGYDGGRTPTIYDVATEAGVAPSTVSRAFSRPGRVNSETAARIRAVADQLGYRVNPVARALSTARTSLIAVVVADIANPFFAAIIRGVQAGAAQAGYTVLLIDSEESEAIERESLIRALPLVDGVVLGSSRLSDSGIRTVAKQRPVVVVNRVVSGVPSVVIDNRGGVRSALGHLAGLGHNRLTYAAGPEASWPDGVRWRAVRELAGGFGLSVRRRGPFAPTIAGGMRAAEVLRQHPTPAVVAYNDQVAIGIMRRLAQLGARIPANVSVVGFDNIVPAELVTPGLTTVEAPLYAQGTTAVGSLLATISGARLRTGRAVVLPTRLVVRGSTAAPGPCDPASWEGAGAAVGP
jgi:LacI family transcriptional regulator, repressor for deo operon, udp, cdd, tsx, nupC, and nupG